MNELGKELSVLLKDGNLGHYKYCKVDQIVLLTKSKGIINYFTHIDFLEKTIGYIPKTISCRFNPGGKFLLSNGIMDNPGDAKYGFTEPQLFEGFKILKEKGKLLDQEAIIEGKTIVPIPLYTEVSIQMNIKKKR